MALKVAERARAVAPFYVMEVMRAAGERERAREAVYHMEVGQPSTSAPAAALAAAHAALQGDRLGYTDALGAPALRQAIAAHYRAYYGVAVDPASVVVTTGSSGAFVLAFLTSFAPGDRVALAAPGYPCYRNILSALGVEPVSLATDLAHRFQPTVELLDRAQRAVPLDGLIVASPSNPTGTMLPEAELAALAVYCERHGIRLISDEIYHGITYGARAATALASSRSAVVVNSFSKYYSMTGWRIGWMVVPEAQLRAVESLAQNLFISPPALSQVAALAALDCREELDSHVARYGRNRSMLLKTLPRAGFDRIAPADGAFYLYADVSALTNDSQAFCARMLHATGVAATPGVDFDPDRGARFVRFSFAGATEALEQAADWLIAWRAAGYTERLHPSRRALTRIPQDEGNPL